MKNIIKKLSPLFLVATLFLVVSLAPTKAEENVSATVTSTMPSVTTSGGTSVATPPATVTNTQGQTLEKIPMPALIKEFTNIIKRGMTLYGQKIKERDTKKEENQTPTTSPGIPVAAPSTTTGTIEKIATPKDISLFEKIQKKGTALWGVRKVSSYRIVTAEESACVISALEKKDQALQDNNVKAASGFNTAISARTTCQKSALASVDNQKENLDKCVKVFKEASKQVRSEAKKAHESAWKTYRDSLKSCAKTVTTASSTVATPSLTSEIVIEDGGGNITEIETITED